MQLTAYEKEMKELGSELEAVVEKYPVPEGSKLYTVGGQSVFPLCEGGYGPAGGLKTGEVRTVGFSAYVVNTPSCRQGWKIDLPLDVSKAPEVIRQVLSQPMNFGESI